MTEDEVRQAIAKSGAILEAQGTVLQELLARHQLLYPVLLALIRSHPDPSLFARELRRAAAHSQLTLTTPPEMPANPIHDAALDSLLSDLERYCKIPLNLRPPKG